MARVQGAERAHSERWKESIEGRAHFQPLDVTAKMDKASQKTSCGPWPL